MTTLTIFEAGCCAGEARRIGAEVAVRIAIQHACRLHPSVTDHLLGEPPTDDEIYELAREAGRFALLALDGGR